jgi:multisubunit Na+/H+ antiporter MnhC subunit
VSAYLFQMPSSHSQRIREDSRLTAVKASSPLRAAMAVTAAVVVVVVVVVVAVACIAARRRVWVVVGGVMVPARGMRKQ